MPPETPKRSTPGRPRLYQSDSEKVEAFRERQEKAGYSRKEVLVTAQTAARLSDLAKEQGVTVTDVASGLLEYGLKRYDETAPAMPRASSVGENDAFEGAFDMAPLASAMPAPRASRSAAPHASLPEEAPRAESKADSKPAGVLDPIHQFFARRKGQR